MRPVNRRAMLFRFLLSPLFVRAAAAHNCSPDNPSDCERTAGYNTGLAVGGTIAAIGGALFGASLGEDGSDQTPPDNTAGLLNQPLGGDPGPPPSPPAGQPGPPPPALSGDDPGLPPPTKPGNGPVRIP
jgi:hypothetical protein